MSGPSTASEKTQQDPGRRRVACVQFAPRHGDIKHNVETVRELTKSIPKGSVNLLVLPEMALTGYVFRDAEEIAPLIEDPAKETASDCTADVHQSPAPSLTLARELAHRLDCHVAIGFPCRWTRALERHLEQHALHIQATLAHDARLASLREDVDSLVYQDVYNAVLLVNEHGTLIHVARKHFAFEDDKRWSAEGPGFQTVTLDVLGKVCFAICMDLNPYNFEAPFDAFELAHYCQREHVDLLVVSMAWLKDKLPPDTHADERKDVLIGGPDLDTINYWALRLSPFIPAAMHVRDNGQAPKQASPASLRFVACNITGTEHLSRFAGSSCGLAFDNVAAQPCAPRLLDALGREQGVLVLDI